MESESENTESETHEFEAPEFEMPESEGLEYETVEYEAPEPEPPESKTPESETPPPKAGRIRRRLISIREAVTPGPLVRTGFARGAFIFAVVVALLAGLILRPGLGPIQDTLIGLAFGLTLALLLIGTVCLVIKLLSLLPRVLPWTAIGAIAMIAIIFLLLPAMAPLAPVYAAGVTLVQAFFGAAILLLLRVGYRNLHPFKRVVVITVAVVGTVMNLYLLGWMVYPGSARHLTQPREDVAVAALGMPDPSQPGSHAVHTLIYGSGTDMRRPEYGPGVDIVTPTVDASPFTDAHKLQKWLREWYWGFDRDAFPLNGRIWRPEGDGPFPLVLIVHGNHQMEHHSDPGYEWIAEHLAGRGFIAASVDQNFLNISWHGNWRKENDARAWMLLQHLALWRAWNADPESPLHGTVDMDRVALIGHSRGGEAAAIAAAFNRLAYYPDDARQPFDFGFGIRAVIAIAPTDGQYRPANQATPLEDINYLVLSGGHDADVAAYLGKRQYNRTRFTANADAFKASVYAYRANHGQFNTLWGRADLPFPLSRLLNTRPLMTGEEQRQIGRVYFTAFLETTLHGEEGYRPMFQDHRGVAEWLPEDLILTRYEDGHFQPIARYDEDIDLTTTTMPGGRIEGEGLTFWREKHLPFRVEELTKENPVVEMGWNHDGNGPAPSYTIHLPESLEDFPIAADATLSFALAESRSVAPKADDENGDNDHAERDALDFTVELVDAEGVSARLPLSHFRAIQPPLIARFSKLWSEEHVAGGGWEPVMQTFLLPLDAFTTQTPGLDPARLQTIRFLFDQSPEGRILLDDIGVQG